MPHALLIDDDQGFREAMAEVVRAQGFTVDLAASLREARLLLRDRAPDVVLLDVQLPDGRGSEMLAELAGEIAADIVVITGNASVDSAVEALRYGAADYLVKPLDVARLQAVLTNVVRRSELGQEVETLRRDLREFGHFGALLGSSPPMQALYDAISRVAPTSATVFVRGESGTGKELVAQTVHSLSRRKKQRFLALNCSAVSPQLIESELFGHERGSFTGADRMHRGYFERADGGTLFLDEVTEMPLELQVRLLRVLETRMVTRVGGEQQLPTDVRIIAATNRDPEQAVADGKLRQDLLYRLAVFPLEIPPLRERGNDVRLLAQAFLSTLNEAERTDKRFTAHALAALQAHSWPGNVRELKNAVERSYILADHLIDGPQLTIGSEGSAAEGDAGSGDAGSVGAALGVAPGMSIGEAEKRLIMATLSACDGNKVQAAGMLKISLKTLYNRLNEYGASSEGPDARTTDSED
jgi:two-component system, NtrC family, response regulator AtoC